MAYYSFDERHNGPSRTQLDEMLRTSGAADLNDLISKTIPASILLQGDMDLEESYSEFE